MTLQKIKAAVEKLSPAELAKFRKWFEEVQEHQWDQQIARDDKAGRLDRATARALANLRSGRVKDIG